MVECGGLENRFTGNPGDEGSNPSSSARNSETPTKQMIYEYAWGEEYLAEDKTINVHISNIRSKLKRNGTDTYIQTVWGMGFKLS